MNRIDRIEASIIDVPTIRAHVLSMTTMTSQSIVLVRIFCSDGSVGIGEGTTIGGLSYGDESCEGIKLAIDTYIAPVLSGLNADSIGLAMQTVGSSVKGNHIAKCAVETALYDAFGRRVGLPVAELLGGRQRESLPVAWTLASGKSDVDIDEAERVLAARRHNIFKIKIGKRTVDDDVAHVTAIKAAVGDRGSVRVDVNQAWDLTQARIGLATLGEAGVDLVEQPVRKHLVDALAQLTRDYRIAVMADEALHGPEDAFRLAAANAADVFAVKIAQSGGLIPGGKVGAIADAAGIGLYGGTMLESAVGTAASAHLFATFPNLTWGTELFGPLLLTEDLLAEPLVYRDFSLEVPTAPGLGVTLDEDKVAFFRRDRGTTQVSFVKSAAGP
jgi:muconate cycloisomerase